MNDYDVMIASVTSGDIASTNYCREHLTMYEMAKLIEMRTINA